jgi:hypothetical protein
LAYFNWASGGPDREPARLIDSNLDWGQDLVGLQKWWKQNIPDQEIGLAYFGQINPSIFALRGEPFSWYLPPVRSETTIPVGRRKSRSIGPAKRVKPGYYAISRTTLHGLPWRFYDPDPTETMPAWNAAEPGAFSYFQALKPIKTIGHSINIYKVDDEQAARLDAEL